MIEEIKISNILSFKNEVTFSFEASKDTTYEDGQVCEMAQGIRLLRLAVVFGANASGKSNLLKVLDFLRTFWFQSHDSIDETTGIVPFLLDAETPTKPSRIELRFWVGDVRYWYQLELDVRVVISEKLYYYRSNQPTMLFHRTQEDGRSLITFNPVATKVSRAAQESLTLKCLPNMSVFAARNQVNMHIPVVDDARNWMRTSLMPMITPKTDLVAEGKAWTDDSLRGYLLDFIRKADFNVTGFTTSNERLPLFSHTVENERGKETYSLPSALQSAGTLRTVGIESAIFEAMQRESVLTIDEIEASLHPDLVEFVLQRFLGRRSRSQLIVTTHYDPLLNTIGDLMRRDSVWFTEKGAEGATALYSLIEFKGLNRISSFQKAYRNGRFGALPNIKN